MYILFLSTITMAFESGKYLKIIDTNIHVQHICTHLHTFDGLVQ